MIQHIRFGYLQILQKKKCVKVYNLISRKILFHIFMFLLPYNMYQQRPVCSWIAIDEVEPATKSSATDKITTCFETRYFLSDRTHICHHNY